MLRAHGWEPGQYLGAKDAPHAQWHTAANASHIRVVLKEDNLGIGAGRNQGDQCTGLNDFQDILGRLNGKADAVVETERKVREDVIVSLYVQRKFGPMRFVKGGWLVGDQVQETPEAGGKVVEIEDSKDMSDNSESPETEEEQAGEKAKKSKKRKLEDGASTQDDGAKKSKKRRAEDGSGTETEKEKRRRERKEKKSKKREDAAAGAASESDAKAANGETEEAEEIKAPDTKKRSKKEKKAKEKKVKTDESSESESKLSKKKKRRKTEEEFASDDATLPASSSSIPKDASGTSTPSGSGYSTPIRNASRRKFITQKRMAFADPKALNQVKGFGYQFLPATKLTHEQIFMIKSES
jgi:Pin2-interacting protein X1